MSTTTTCPKEAAAASPVRAESERQVFDECRRLAAAVAPELREYPLYLLDTRETNRPEHSNVYSGYTMRGGRIDPHLRNVLKARGKWRGPGPIIVLCVPMLAHAAEGFRVKTLQVMLHELAHVLPAVRLREPTGQNPEVAAKWRYEHALSYEDDSQRGQIEAAIKDADDHGARFIRVALHLWIRAVRAGWLLPLTWLCAGHVTNLSPVGWFSPPSRYLEALDDEPIRMAEATFAEIEATDPPAEFSRLWEYDLQANLTAIRNRESEIN